MAFQFYIDGFLTDQPDNGTDLVTVIKRDSELGGFLTTQEVTLIYSGNNAPAAGEISGYTYLKNMFDSGTCNEAELIVYDVQSSTETYRVYTGVIKVPSIVIEEHITRLSTKIDDNSFYSYIKNNQNVRFSLYADKTKNGLPVTPPQIYRGDFYVSNTGVYLSSIGNYYQGYRIYDILKFLIPALSDNKVSFESDFLSSPDIQLFLYDGSALANANTTPSITVTFRELIDELFKLKNLSFYIDQIDPDNPVLRLEDASWFFVDNNIMTFTEPKDVKTSVKNTKIPGTIKVGSQFNPGTSGTNTLYTFNAGTSYFGWKEESYTPFGQCNTDVELNLVNTFNISSNAINDQVNGAVTSNLDDLFIVEMDDVDTTLFTATAVDYELFSQPVERYYNVGLNNVNKIGLHGGNFQSALTNTQNVGSDICHITLGADFSIVDFNVNTSPHLHRPLAFADEFGGANYDGGNNWSLVNFNYTTPNAGNYSFRSTVNFQVTNCTSSVTEIRNVNFFSNQWITTNVQWGVEVTAYITAYSDNTYTTQYGSASGSFFTWLNQIYTIDITLPIDLPAGAVVVVSIITTAERFAPDPFGTVQLTGQQIALGLGITPLGSGWQFTNNNNPYPGVPNRIVYALADSTFECNGTPDGGLILGSPNLSLYKIKLHEFQWDLTTEEFRTIEALPIGSFEFIKDDVSRSGWIEQLTYNNWTGRTQIKLITQDATV